MSESNLAINANINQKVQPNSISVHGSVIVYTEETEVSITKADPQGINNTILLLKLTIVENPGPMKGIPRSFSYEERGVEVNQYKQAQLISNKGDDITVDVEVFG